MRVDGRIFKWEKDFAGTVVRLAVPIILQSFMTAMMSIVDNLMIGQLGELEMAAVTQANRLTFWFQLTMFGLVGGCSTFTAQFWGKNDLDGIHQVHGLALRLAMGLSLVFALPAVLIPEKILGLLLADAQAVRIGASYLRIVGIGYLFQSVSQIYGAVQKSTQQVILPMGAGIAAIVTNTCLNALLIFGSLGAPKLGVQGAAIATVTGWALEMLLVVVIGNCKKMMTRFTWEQLRIKTPDFVRRYLKVALPIMINESLWSLGVTIYSVVYGHMSNSAVAAMSVFSNVEQLTMVVLRGMTHACAVLVGMEIGAGREDRAQLNAMRMLVGGMIVAQLTGMVVALFGSQIAHVFNISAETAQSVEILVREMSMLLWLMAANNILIVGVLRAGGDVHFSMWVDPGTVWLIGAPLVYLGGIVLKLPIYYVYLLSQTENLAKAALGFWRLKSGRWIHNLVKEQPAEEALISGKAGEMAPQGLAEQEMLGRDGLGQELLLQEEMVREESIQ